jgi:hypothetical protein
VPGGSARGDTKFLPIFRHHPANERIGLILFLAPNDNGEESGPMALQYQTEYRLGNRGHVRRSYTGLQAFVAIIFDLIFGLVFELVTSVISLALRLVVLLIRFAAVVLVRSWGTLVSLMTAFVYLVTFPIVLLHHAVERLRSQVSTDGPSSHMGSSAKPDWAFGREV